MAEVKASRKLLRGAPVAGDRLRSQQFTPRQPRNNATTGQIWYCYKEYCWFSGAYCGGVNWNVSLMNGRKWLQILTSCSAHLVVPLNFKRSHCVCHGLLRVKVNSPRKSRWPLMMRLNLFWPSVLLNLQCQSLMKLYPPSLWCRKKIPSSLGLHVFNRPTRCVLFHTYCPWVPKVHQIYLEGGDVPVHCIAYGPFQRPQNFY